MVDMRLIWWRNIFIALAGFGILTLLILLYMENAWLGAICTTFVGIFGGIVTAANINYPS